MKQREILLCKYGEIVLKGANRKYFEDTLCREMKKRARAYGSFDIYRICKAEFLFVSFFISLYCFVLVFVIVGEKHFPNLATCVCVGCGGVGYSVPFYFKTCHGIGE